MMEPPRILFSMLFAIVAVAVWTIVHTETLTAAASRFPLGFAGLGNDEVQQQQRQQNQQPSSSLGKDDWNILYHLGGNGPWIQKTDGVVEGGVDVPEGCYVDQVHMMSRHAERYPTTKAGIRMLELYHRLKPISDRLKGDLAFIQDWDFFVPDPQSHLESLIPVGPYAGTLSAFNTGVELRTRYAHLLQHALLNNQTSFWASGSKRVIETARYFGSAFFGLDEDARSASSSSSSGSSGTRVGINGNLIVVPETADLGGNTLTPGDTCKNYVENTDGVGHDYGYHKLAEWQAVYLPPIAARLNEENPDLDATPAEVYVMQEMCGFETLALGKVSKWCGVFSHGEMEQFEYARDVLHYYRSGPGNKYGALMGWLWLNATTNLLAKGGHEAGPLFFSFVHDGDIIPLLAALDPFSPSPSSSPSSPDPESSPIQHHLPTTHIPANRTWRTSSLVPMSGRVIFERLYCPRPHCWAPYAPMFPHIVYCNHDPPGHDHDHDQQGRQQQQQQEQTDQDPTSEAQHHRQRRQNQKFQKAYQRQQQQEEEAEREKKEQDASPTSPPNAEIFVRINVNDGIVPLSTCDSGPGRSCPLDQWQRSVMLRGWELGDFRRKCGLRDGGGEGDAPGAPGIEFLHQ